MAPTIYTIDGVNIIIYPNEHDPIHIHAKYAEYETVYELFFDNGILTHIGRRANGRPMIPATKDKKTTKLIEKYNLDIVKKWTQIVVLKKTVRLTKITNL